jgi:hypothetical protein
MVKWGNTDLYSDNLQVYNHGLWDCLTNNTLEGTLETPTLFNNYGIFRKSGGDFISGSTYLGNNITFVNPGLVDVQFGMLWMGRNCNLAGGTLNFGLNGPTDYGWLSLSSTGSLSGTLSVNLNNGYAPATSDFFALVRGVNLTGGFAGRNLPPLSPGLIWQTNWQTNDPTQFFILSVTNVPPFSLTSGSITQAGGAFSFSFEAIVGQTYQVQCTTNMAPANWINLGAPVTATNASMTVSDLIGPDEHRFYRVVLQ